MQLKLKLRNIVFFAICLLLGFSIAVQAKVTNGQQLYVSSKAIDDLKITIESEIKDTDRVSELIEAAEIRLAEYKILAESEDNEMQNRLLEELEN